MCTCQKMMSCIVFGDHADAIEDQKSESLDQAFSSFLS